MPVLEDTNQSQTSGGTWKAERNGVITNSGTYSSTNTGTLVYRFGTGRRPLPPDLDPSAYTRESRITVGPIGKYVLEYSAAPSGRSQTYEGPYPNPGAWQSMRQTLRGDRLTNMEQVAKVRALKKLDNRDMDLGTAWAERSKTADLVRTVADTALDALRAARRGDGRGMLNAFGLDDTRAAGEGFVNTYLTWKYGMTPLLNDVRGAAKALARKRPEDWSVRTRGGYDDDGSLDRTIDTTHALRVQSKYSKGVRVSVSAVQRPLMREQDNRWATGLDNPLATTWEIIPYSFVADWMFGIGDWLQALNTLKYYSGWKIVTSARQTEQISLTGATASGTSGRRTTTLNRPGRENSFFLYRTVSSNPMVGVPIRDPRSLTNMANALSLLAAAAYRADIRPIIRY